MEPLHLEIAGMSCGHCVARVTRALTAMDGLHVVNVTVGMADVEYDPARTAPEAIVGAVESAGYDATIPAPGR